MSLTVELPDSLIEHFRERGIPDEELKARCDSSLGNLACSRTLNKWWPL